MRHIKYYSDSAPSYGMVQKWFTEFRFVRTSTEIIPSLGRPNEITTPEINNNSILCAQPHNEGYYATSDNACRRSKPRRDQSCEDFKQVS